MAVSSGVNYSVGLLLLAGLRSARRANGRLSFPPMNAKFVSLIFLFCTALGLIGNSFENNSTGPIQAAVTSHIPREPISSKGIASIGYSKRLHILEIELMNRAVYRYLEVAPSVHRELMAAESKASYYDRNIKGNFPSVRVRSRVKQ